MEVFSKWARITSLVIIMVSPICTDTGCIKISHVLCSCVQCSYINVFIIYSHFPAAQMRICSFQTCQTSMCLLFYFFCLILGKTHLDCFRGWPEHMLMMYAPVREVKKTETSLDAKHLPIHQAPGFVAERRMYRKPLC